MEYFRAGSTLSDQLDVGEELTFVYRGWSHVEGKSKASILRDAKVLALGNR